MATPQAPEKWPVIRIRAVNSAAASKGSIHDDEKAREMGFAGGFVPGSTVLGYLGRWMHEAFGERWYEGATLTARLRRPVYEGAEVTVEGGPSESPAADGRINLDVRVIAPDGTVAAVGTATCAAGRRE